MDAVPSIGDLLTRVPSWRGRSIAWRRLAGGLSHHIYLVEVDGEPSVLRILSPAIAAAGLGIEPQQEIDNTLLAARTGVGPAVTEILVDIPALVLEFLPGRTLNAADVRNTALIPAIAAACRQLHAGAPFRNAFDIFDKRDELLGICRRHGLRLPDRYLDRLDDGERIRTALAAEPLPALPCHNDLLAANLIEQGGEGPGGEVGGKRLGGEGPGGEVDGRQAAPRIRIIDYQLAGQNDPAFELGDIAAEADYNPDLVDRLAAAYFGADLTPALVARVRLYLIASNITWTLWFTVHHGLLDKAAEVDFDYDEEAADKWGQAERDLDDHGFGRLLDTVAGRPRRNPSTPNL